MNSFWRFLRPTSNPPAAGDSASSDDAPPNSPAINAFFRKMDAGDITDPSSNLSADFGGASKQVSARTSRNSFAFDTSDIDGGPDDTQGSDFGDDQGSTMSGPDMYSDDGDIDAVVDNEDEYSDDAVDGSEDDSEDDSGDDSEDNSGDGVDGGTSNGQATNFATSQYKGDGAAANLQGFNRRPYSRNSEAIFGTAFDPNNATALSNGGMNIHMQGDSGSEITAAQNATAYGSYTTTTKSMDVHGANQTGFFYGDGRKFEVDLFEPALNNGDVNTFTSGMWLDNVKVAETSVKASDLGFNSFHDQPMTYKMDFQPGNIKISALNSKGEWQTIVDHSDPRISDHLARDTNFKQMFSAWGVNGQYNGAPVDFQVLKTGYSSQPV